MGKRGNNEGSIRKRDDGLYEARISVGGGKRKSLYGQTRHEVAAKMATALRNQTRGQPLALDERTRLATYCQDWMKQLEARNHRPSTLQRYRELATLHILPTLGRVPLAKLTVSHLEHLYVAIQRPHEDGKGVMRPALSSSTAHRVHSLLHTMLGEAVHAGLIERNVADIAHAPKDREYQPQLWTMAETRLFLEAARHHRDGPLFLLIALTGMRLGEALGLHWADVDMDTRAVAARLALDRYQTLRPPKTKAGRRRIELPDIAISVLRAQRAQQLRERLAVGAAWQGGEELLGGFVFTDALGQHLKGNTTLRRFQRFTRRHKLPQLKIHELRHLQASILLAAGINPKTVQERLGHTKVQLTLDTYSHLMSTLQREAADVLDQVFGTWEPAQEDE